MTTSTGTHVRPCFDVQSDCRQVPREECSASARGTLRPYLLNQPVALMLRAFFFLEALARFAGANRWQVHVRNAQICDLVRFTATYPVYVPGRKALAPSHGLIILRISGNIITIGNPRKPRVVGGTRVMQQAVTVREQLRSSASPRGACLTGIDFRMILRNRH